jgi:hypothetical protein
MKKTWIETERQGRGRRYWFDTRDAAIAFYDARGRRGFREGSTVWLPNGRRADARVAAGVDPLSLND